MVFRRGEFLRLIIESVVDSRRQLAKLESKENDSCLRDLWREKSNMRVSLRGLTRAAEVISARV